MTGLRSYGDPCGIARALDVLGERWAMLIVRELLLGPKRFSDLKEALGMSPNVLTQRLAELEVRGVVEKRRGLGALYALTDWGLALRPILLQLGRWGARSPEPPRGELSVDAMMLALEATFVPARAGDLRARYEVRLGDERFGVEVLQGRIHVQRGQVSGCDARIETDVTTLQALLFGGKKLPGAPVVLHGDAAVARAFFRLFAHPSMLPEAAYSAHSET